MTGWTRDQMAQRIAGEIQDGFAVNLGIGMPTLVSNFIPDDKQIMLQSENGLLGMGGFPLESKMDADLINAGKQTVTTVAGASFFSSAESFAMIRGQHVDLTVLGAMEISQNGDIANWMIPGKMVKGMGGAMDLVASAKRVIVMMSHTSKSGKSKLLKHCQLPLTGVECVNHVITNLGYFEVTGTGFKVLKMAPEITKEEIQKQTEAQVIF